MGTLADARAFVFDVDGTLALSDDPNAGAGIQPLPGAVELLRKLRSEGVPFLCFTNGTGQVPAQQAARLRNVGLEVDDTQLVTPAVIAATYIRKMPETRVLAFGNDGLLEPLRQARIALVTLKQAEQANVVLVGADPSFTYDKLVAACCAIWNGAQLLVTSMAPWFASRRGRMPSTSGAIVAGITHVTGAQPVIVGKPSSVAMDTLAELLDRPTSQLAMVGDDVHLEIRMGRDAGAFTALVLSGSTARDDLPGLPSEHQPHVILENVGELIDSIPG